MKRIFVVILMIVLSAITAKTEIKTKKEGKILLVEFYIPRDSTALFESDSTMSWSFVEKDLQDALIHASQGNYRSMIIYDKDGDIFMIFKGKEQLTMSHISEKIDQLGYIKHIEGEIIGKKTIKRSVAKYRQDTYLNGKLHDTYESDWSSGWFAPKTSTYKSGGDTYETRTYYLPPSSETVEVRGPGEDVEVKGYTVFAEKVYRQE